jgi:PIN domain nuclease of toxin-antitoxin system
MKALLDTNVFLWAATADRRLSVRARTLLNDRRNSFLLSVGSIWEILVKTSIGKLDLPAPVDKYLKAQILRAPVTVLPILLSHVWRIEGLPLHHRDPFDRILIAQALDEGMPIVTADQALRAYPVDLVW